MNRLGLSTLFQGISRISAIFINACVFAFLLVATVGCNKQDEQPQSDVLRIGIFPNLTHAHGLIARHMNRLGEDIFRKSIENSLGRPIQLRFYSYNAGPGAMEAMFAGSLDASYVGPGPAINAYAKSKGNLLEVVSGAVLGGSGLVVPQQLANQPIAGETFRGKTVATPQLGNTQDVACRSWFEKQGLHVTTAGGDVRILPTPNPEQLSLFRSGKLDGVWTVEPWISRLESQAGGVLVLPEPEAVTTVLVVNKRYENKSPDVTQALIKAHRELTAWINEHPEEAQKMVIEELQDITHSAMDPELVRKAWGRMNFSTELDQAALDQLVRDATKCGFYKTLPDINGILRK
jgi:NitT/TauT family transport system substrate-binding protein